MDNPASSAAIPLERDNNEVEGAEDSSASVKDSTGGVLVFTGGSS